MFDWRKLKVNTFWRWWGEGLLACLPTSLQQRLQGGVHQLVMQITEQEMVVYQEHEGNGKNGELSETEGFGRYQREAFFHGEIPIAILKKAKSEPLILRLPLAKSLVRTLSLPAAAEQNLRQVVGFEIDRHTPFTAPQVYYDAQVLERQSALRRLQVRLVAAPRAAVDDLLLQLSKIGLAPVGVDVVGNSGVNLLPPERRARRGRTLRRLQWSLAVVCFVLLGVAMLLPLWQQRALIIELVPRVNAAQQEAEQILSLRQELDNVRESSRFLLQKRQDSPLMVELLQELTTILPDGTWVEYVDIRDNEIQIRGQSTQASALISLLEKSEFLQGATFRSPITADRRTGKDRFHVAAQIANPAS